MGTTAAPWTLPYPEETDTADVPVDMKELADRLQIHLAAIDARVAAVEAAAGSVAILSDVKVAAPVATIDFPNIPQTYSHLRMVVSARADSALIAAEIFLQFNGVATATYDRQRIYATGATPNATELLAQTSIAIANIPAANALANLFGVGDLMVWDYTQVRPSSVQSTFYRKSSNSAGDSIIGVYGGTARAQSAVTRMTLSLPSGNFVAGSRFTLYGLRGL